MTIPDRSRERRACDAVARCLERIAGSKRSNACCPEDSAKGSSAVDYAFDLGQQAYAFEHTVVEAFEGQLRTDEQFGKFVEPIEAALDYRMPGNGYFLLSFPIDPSNGMKPKAIVREQEEIIVWAQTAAGELVNEAARMPPRLLRRSPPSRKMTNSEVTLLFREDFIGAMGGRLLAQRTAPPNYEQLRKQRIQDAVDRKAPKLAKCKPARTVLLLENRDIALSNHWLISGCLEDALRGRSDMPDEVWLVDAVHQGFWVSICLRQDGVTFPHENEDVRFWEFKPSELDAQA